MVIIVTDEGWVQKILRELEGELLEERESLLDHEICIIDKCENEGLEKMAVGEFEDMYGEDAYEAYRHAEEEGRVPEGMEDVLVYEVWEAERMMWEAPGGPHPRPSLLVSGGSSVPPRGNPSEVCRICSVIPQGLFTFFGVRGHPPSHISRSAR